MKQILTILIALLSFVAVQAQTQEYSIIIDEQSFQPVQADGISNVPIDKIKPDNSRRPCARIKMRINRMTRDEIEALIVRPIGGSVVVMKQMIAAEGNGLIIELTAKEPTRFYLHSDKYGDSNEVSLNLQGDKEYRISAQLNSSYPIFVNSDAADAEVYIDDSFKGKTNDNFTLTVMDVSPGEHTLRILYGSAVAEKQIVVSKECLDFRLNVNTASSHPQYVVFDVAPRNAIIIIDNKSYMLDENGNTQIMFHNGSYNYEIVAKDYHTEKGTFMVSGDKVEKVIELKPAFGWLSIDANDTLQDASIFVDDNLIGTTPINQYKITSGEHHIRIVKDMYVTHEQTITINDAQELKYNTTLATDFATVTLTADDGSDIYVNGTLKGKSPWSGVLASGTYIFEARKEGHNSTTLSKSITNTEMEQSYTLAAPTPITGRLNIVSSPIKADVFVDDKLVGQTPLMHEILIGTHRVAIRKEGYRSYTQSVAIAENIVVDVNATLKEGNEIIPNNVIEYVMSGHKAEISNAFATFGANIKSHTWNNETGRGVITFDRNITEIGIKAFQGFENLEEISLPNSVTIIGPMAFDMCNNLVNIFMGPNVTKIGSLAFSRCESLASITIPNGTTTIESFAFSGCESLTSVTIPNSVTTIENYAFYDCKNLSKLTIGSNVTTIGESAFTLCSSLKSVIIPDSVTTIQDRAFAYCTNVTNAIIGSNVATLGTKVFYGCTKLKKVYFKPLNPPSVGIESFKRNASGRKMYVPKECVKSYQGAKDWDRYLNAITGYNVKEVLN